MPVPAQKLSNHWSETTPLTLARDAYQRKRRESPSCATSCAPPCFCSCLRRKREQFSAVQFHSLHPRRPCSRTSAQQRGQRGVVKTEEARAAVQLSRCGLQGGGPSLSDRIVVTGCACMRRISFFLCLLLVLCAAEDPSDPSFLLNRMYRTYTEATESPCVRILNETTSIGCGGTSSC